MTQPEDTKPNWLAKFEGLAQENLGRPLELRDYFYLLDLDFDPDAQIDAILSLLQQHGELAEETREEIQRREDFAKKCKGLRNELAVGGCIDMMQYSTYQDAAHSMAAVGMLAPLFETLFTQCFTAIHRQYGQAGTATNGHARWQAAGQQAWDCHYVFAGGQRRKDLVQGILQLSDAAGLREHLPRNTDNVLAALFAYRNKMFHCGFEWPVPERESFAKRIVDEGWPTEWFQRASQNEQPWIFYMSHKFVEECQLTFKTVLDAFCEFVKKLIGARERDGGTLA